MTFLKTATTSESLLKILKTRRPFGSKAEKRFNKSLVQSLSLEVDGFGNMWRTVGNSNVMWSCHTDTVHRDGGKQTIKIVDGMAVLKAGTKSNCLGADDGAGIWLMSEMIRASVPGLYCFHRGEERGGVGSQYVVYNEPWRVDGIKFCIALDRKGYGDVITHQMARCCSDDFAFDLSRLLGGQFKPDDTGVFTDSAIYVDIIPECTNLSVGYFMQHGPKESLDLQFLSNLRDTLCTVDFSSLTVYRDPLAIEPESIFEGLGFDDSDYGLLEYIERNPNHVVDLMRAYGLDLTDLQDCAIKADDSAYTADPYICDDDGLPY